MGVNTVSAHFGVPTSTLCNQLSDRVAQGTHPGVVSHLERDEDMELAEYMQGRN